MKKIFVAIACMLAAGSTAAMAQNNTTNGSATCNQVQCGPANCNQIQCGPANCNQVQCGPANCNQVSCSPNECGNIQGICGNPCGNACSFNDLNLTDTQKKQLQELNQNFQNKKKALFDQKKANKSRNDSTKSSMRKQAKELRSQKLSEIKSILTPEQYTKFLENYYLNGNNQGKNFHKGTPHHQFRQKGEGRPQYKKSDKKFSKISDKKSDKKNK